MKKKKIWLAAAAIAAVCCLILLFVKGGDKGYSGSYRAVNPPVETGETVIERVSFEGKQLVMESGDLKQSVDYAIADGRLVLKTEFGEFSFPFEKTEAGIRIDGIEYIKD
ncbi:MAG: hypothetical protein KHX84_11415 [Enterocloster asparagiformis]|nr:hypothetical protein [Enterocloster asparagiformis]